MKAVTPFGTDERTGPRVLTYDITPLAPLLVGNKPLGLWVDTYDLNRWWVDVDFTFTADPNQASPKPPADGIQPVFFKQRVTAEDQKGIQPVPVTVPDDAQQVFVRLFSTGHGAVGQPPCDEFCQRVNRILVDDQPTWQQVVWRTDCAFNQEGESCRTWNACGYPSCTFPRSGWCPGYIACQNSEPCDHDLDATAWLPPGGTYDVLYNIQNLTPGGAYWNYSLVVYWYK
jgi:hypothetical protein